MSLQRTATPKPVKHASRVAAQARQVLKRLAKAVTTRRKKLADYQADKAIRFACWERDKGRCRACGVTVPFQHPSLIVASHNHHIQYRSAGGSDESFNRVTLDWACHSAEHDGLLSMSGDANGMLLFTLRDKKQIVRKVWGSPANGA